LTRQSHFFSGPAGAHELATALRTNTHLVKLNLKDNSLGEAGARELAAMLTVCGFCSWFPGVYRLREQAATLALNPKT